MKIDREIYPELCAELRRKEVSILLGPRQVGKTFLLKELKLFAEKQKLKTRYFNLEIPADIMYFNKSEVQIFELLTKNTDVLFIDEFHYLKNASKLFKAIYDSDQPVKIYCSGSSSIEIHKHLKESLAGRRLVSLISPLSFQEFAQTNINKLFSEYLTYGGLPGLLQVKEHPEKIRILNEILETYIQKDIKSLIKEENIRAFNYLLYLLAERQGSLISVNSLANEIGLTSVTINKHLTILEQTYICFSVYSYSRKLGNELKKSRKIYFYDSGIRNAILKDFSRLEQRSDKGAMHEAFVFCQLQKQLQPNMELKFWRNKQGQEIDFVLLKDRKPFLIEVKTSLAGLIIPAAFKTFIKAYPETAGGLILSQKLDTAILYENKKIKFLSLDRFDGKIFS